MIIIIIITHFPHFTTVQPLLTAVPVPITHFTAVQPVLTKVPLSPTKHLIFTSLPKTLLPYSMYQLLLLSALDYIEGAEIKQFYTFL
jgi:hypothetical protein